jgi:hypothetical protein
LHRSGRPARSTNDCTRRQLAFCYFPGRHIDPLVAAR